MSNREPRHWTIFAQEPCNSCGARAGEHHKADCVRWLLMRIADRMGIRPLCDPPAKTPAPDEPRTVILVRAPGSSWAYCEDWDGVGQLIDGNDGEYEFEFKKMTQAELDALPEFEGW